MDTEHGRGQQIFTTPQILSNYSWVKQTEVGRQLFWSAVCCPADNQNDSGPAVW
jgi:hypothetical protein